MADLHPALQQMIATSEASLRQYARADGTARMALSLSDRVESIGKRWKDHLCVMHCKIVKVPVPVKKHIWRANFGVEGSSSTVSVVLDDVRSTSKGIRVLEQMAKDIQAIYDLPYVPRVYCGGVHADDYEP